MKMKLLIIISSHELHINWSDNIKILNDYAKLLNIEVDYCGISNQDNFHNYEDIIKFKYKIINTKQQFSKLCDFITDYKSEMDYDWYMKIRPDMKLLENINLDILDKDAINARARVYHGPRRFKYGMSISGGGAWKNVHDCYYAETEHSIVLDDGFFLFHNNTVEKGAFDKITDIGREYEWPITEVYNNRKIPLNVIGINLENTRAKALSGHVNMPWD
jgi:hypothetical protein